MTISDLDTLLNNIVITGATKMKFKHFAWSSKPGTDFGVYAEDSQSEFRADEKIAEKEIEGLIHYFTRDDSGSPKTKIETALDGGGVYYQLDGIQYEQDTGYLHYTWVFRLHG